MAWFRSFKKWLSESAEYDGEPLMDYKEERSQMGVLGAHYLFDIGNVKEAARMFRQAAELGDARSQSLLGYLYAIGRGVEQNYEKAAMWYERAAEQGQAFAQDAIGAMYCDGKGVEQDYEKAAMWYQKAATEVIYWKPLSMWTKNQIS